MEYRIAADAVVIFHLAFTVFALLGGVLVLRWRWLLRLHIPAALWGITVEFSGWMCPLTPLENALRRWGGEAGYDGGFVEHYILPVLYPEGLTRDVQRVLGMIVVTVNAAVYGYVWWRWRKTRAATRV